MTASRSNPSLCSCKSPEFRGENLEVLDTVAIREEVRSHVTHSLRMGRELILATKHYAQESPAKSWWYVLSTASLLALAFAGTFWFDPLGARLACSVVSGLLLLRLFVIYHDQQHHAILSRSRMAEVLMRVFGVFALSASSIWRSSHNHHHSHNSKLRGSQIGSFPVMTKQQFVHSSAKVRFRYLLMRHPLTILCGYLSLFLYGMCLNPFLNNPRKHWDCLLSLGLHLALGGTLMFFRGWEQLLLTQTLPCFITYGIGSYLFYAQHNFPGVVYNDKAGWTYEKAALASSSFLKTNPVMAWFTANIGFHHVHHLNANIPFYRLPETVREMPELQHASITSFHPRDIFRCLRLKVWDVDGQRMIGLREIARGEPLLAAGTVI